MNFNDGPLKINGQICGERIIDGLYRAGNNYYFLDTGWAYSSTHPLHCIGKLVDENHDEWLFEDEEDRLFAISLIESEEDMEFYNGWKTYLKEHSPDLKGINVLEKQRNDFNIPADVKIEQVSI